MNNLKNVQFTYRPVLGGYCEGVTRRDPSPVIRVDGTYHVWYSRTTECNTGYPATIWHATSPDGVEWTEQDEAIGKGPAGAFDEHGVFTPTTLAADGKYYLVYTAVPEPFTNDNGGSNCTPTALGIASADSPDGPWAKFDDNPILRPTTAPNLFDSLRIDDACFVVHDGKYYMYYKGRQKGYSRAETKMGMAVATHPLGPYVRCKQNPLICSGHEVCVFPYGRGMMAIVSDVGPQARTIQYSDDGLNFHVVAEDIMPPEAPGPYRSDHYRDGIGLGITWGLCQNESTNSKWPFLMRFNCNLAAPKNRSDQACF